MYFIGFFTVMVSILVLRFGPRSSALDVRVPSILPQGLGEVGKKAFVRFHQPQPRSTSSPLLRPTRERQRASPDPNGGLP